MGVWKRLAGVKRNITADEGSRIQEGKAKSKITYRRVIIFYLPSTAVGLF